MGYITKNRLLLVMVEVLLILNVAMITYILLRPVPPGPPPRAGGGLVGDLVERELGFTPVQRSEYERLRDEFTSEDAMISLRQAAAKRYLFAYLKKAVIDSDSVSAKIGAVADCERDRSLALFRHFREVRAICSPGQIAKFDRFIDEISRRIENPAGPPPGKPPR